MFHRSNTVSPKSASCRGPTLLSARQSRRSAWSAPLPSVEQELQDEMSETSALSGSGSVETERIGYANELGRPVYNHGSETFGDVLGHPIQEFHRHQQRMESYRRQVEAWENMTPEERQRRIEHEAVFVAVVHFRQLRGNQRFVLTPDQVESFAGKLQLSQAERIQFNGVYDTDSLTDYLHKIKRDYAIKIHHHSKERERDVERGRSNYDTIEFNDNVYVEFRPRLPTMLPPRALELTRRPFFRPPDPDLSVDIGQEKAASWLELFYDLFYVASLTEFTHAHVIKDFATLGTYAEWFIITWWAWFASSLYTARFSTDDVVHHIWKLIEMCAVISMASATTDFFMSPAYVYGYVALKGVLVLEYAIVFIVALCTRSRSSITLAFYVGANIVSIVLWVSSVAVLGEPVHRILWYTGIFVEILVNVISRRDKALSWAASNIAERLGLLTLIVLGENLIGFISLVAAGGLHIWVMVANWFAVVIVFGFFFMYFEDFDKDVFLHSKFHQMWVYLHFPLHLCQIAFGIELVNMLKLYRDELIASGYLPPPTANETAAPSSAEGKGEASAAKLARRAIEETSSEEPYRTGESSTAISFTPAYSPLESIPSSGYLVLIKNAVSTTALATLQALLDPGIASSSTSPLVGQDEHKELASITNSLGKRAEPADGKSVVVEFSPEEMVFIYKIFLIVGGLLLIINSLIKLINTRISDIYGRIIICSRVVNAVVLWCICALPFASLHPLALIGVMMGSLILQAIVDLLD